MNWKFRALAPDGSLVALAASQEVRLPEYHQALEVACTSVVANPTFSGFHVRSSMGSAPGGNVEYGFCQALHSEEFAGAAFRSARGYNSSLDIPVFGLAAREAGRVPTPCGNCRDYLLDEFGPDLETVYGHPDGGIATVIPLRQYLFDQFRATTGGFEIIAQETLRQARRCEYDPYSNPGVHPNRKYFVRLMSRLSLPFYGATDLACDFHPVYPAQDAIRAARQAGVYSLGQVLIVGDGHRPQVMYRDRQHLYEFNLMDELVLGEEKDPPVYLIDLRKGKIHAVWQTSVKEWLPRPFSPRNFADMERLAAYAKAKADR